MKKALFYTAVCAVLVMVCVFPVFAETNTSPTGNITFTITSCETGKNIGGGSIAVYRVASLDGNGNYIPENDFSSLDININSLVYSDSDWSETAENISLYIRNHALTDRAVIVNIDENGCAVLSGVKTGLYAAIQNEAPDGYGSFRPFIIPVPYNDGSEMKYNFDAKPKGTAKLPDGKYTVTFPFIRKTVKGTDKAVNTEFRFRVRPLEKNYPQIVNISGMTENGGDIVSQNADELIVRTTGGGIAEIGSITFDTAGIYYFEVSETDTHEKGFRYDKTVYFCKYSVVHDNEHNTLTISDMTVRYDNANGKILYSGKDTSAFTFDFVNYLDSSPERYTLPQTGQVWFPVILISVTGTVSVIMGVVLFRRKKYEIR